MMLIWSVLLLIAGGIAAAMMEKTRGRWERHAEIGRMVRERIFCEANHCRVRSMKYMRQCGRLQG